MGLNILVIPDYHAIPGVDNKRATVAGRHAASPYWDVIVVLGDWWDYPSLCFWSNKSDLEGTRLSEDYKVGRHAFDLFLKEIRARKKKMPRIIFLEGNHEKRVYDIAKGRPELTSVADDYHPREYLEKQGVEFYPYQEVVEVAGFHFTHAFPSGIMGQPQAGLHIGHMLIQKQKMSCVQGHNHIYDAKVARDGTGKPTRGITAGCFIHPTHKEGWNKNVRHLYDLGLLELHNAADGDAGVFFRRYPEDLK